MTIEAGNSFFAPWPEPDCVTHLFFVLSDPSVDREHVLVVPVMAWDADYKESTCLVDPGEHPFIKHTSYVNYGCAELAPADLIEERLVSGEFRTREPASPELLEKIRRGAEQSDFLELGYRDILEGQGLVDPL
ncbi:MAG: hypothetical protein ACYTKD_13715 [Planctomycetota bacterium]|jgi:hypothetical protein